MRGRQGDRELNSKRKKQLETADAGEKNQEPSGQQEPDAPEAQPSAEARRVIKAIAMSVEASEASEWLREVVRRTRERCKIVPRNGWALISGLLSEKFGKQTTAEEAQALVRTTARPAKRRRGSAGQALHPNSNQGTTPGAGTNCEMATLKRVSMVFAKHLAQNKEIRVEDRVMTRKVPRRMVDEETLAGLNTILGHEVRENAPKDLEDVSLLLYTVQTAYQELTQRERAPSAWKGNMKAKIAEVETEKAILTEHVASIEAHRKSSVCNEVRKILRSKGGKTWDVTDIKRVLRTREELGLVYKRRLELHEERTNFRRTNDFFEFNRRMFYRRLHEGERPAGTQTTEEMVSFWSEVWKRQEGKACFDDLIEHRGLLVEQAAEIEGVPEKLASMMRTLADWKTPGVDKVYNFFIKRCTTLHEKLTEMVEKTIRRPEEAPKVVLHRYDVPDTKDREPGVP